MANTVNKVKSENVKVLTPEERKIEELNAKIVELNNKISALEFEKKALANTVEDRDRELTSLRNNQDDHNAELQKLKEENKNLIEFSDRRVKELQEALTILDTVTVNVSSSMNLVNRIKDSLIKEVQQ